MKLDIRKPQIVFRAQSAVLLLHYISCNLATAFFLNTDKNKRETIAHILIKREAFLSKVKGLLYLR